jgi:hypothetical protein
MSTMLVVIGTIEERSLKKRRRRKMTRYVFEYQLVFFIRH